VEWPKSIFKFYSPKRLAWISQVGFQVKNISQLVLFYKKWGYYLECVWLWRIKWGLLSGDDGVGFGEINIAQINLVQFLRTY